MSKLSFDSVNGFTLIELLVAIAIMAIVGVISLANYSSFGEDQKLKNGSLDIQSLYKIAQTNTSSNTVCSGSNGAKWIVKFSSLTSLDLVCQPSGGVESSSVKNLNLATNSLTITSIKSTSDANCTATLPARVSYDAITAKINFSDNTQQACISSATSLTVNLQNTKNSNTTTVVINKGGTTNVQ
jgi:prepilin-type N-terminal cleavage/methylation domain-containing protein